MRPRERLGRDAARVLARTPDLLARQYDLSVYDASYLELAIRLAVPLATQDGALAAAATKAGLKAG